MQETIHRLKQRPHHERRAIALLIAAGVVIVLFIAWAYAFFSGIHGTTAIQQEQTAQTAAAGASTPVVTPSTDSTTNSNFDQTNTGQ